MEAFNFNKASIDASIELQRVISFVNELYGSYFTIREIHWNTYKMATHKLCDDVSEYLIDTTDSIMEAIMGSVEERPGFGILNPNIPKTEDLKMLLKVLKNKATLLKTWISGDQFISVNNLLDDFIQKIADYIYLSDNS